MIDARLRKIFADALTPAVADSLTPRSTMEDVPGWDSQSFIAIVVGIEAEFGVTFSTLDAARMSSVGSIVEVLGEKGVRLQA